MLLIDPTMTPPERQLEAIDGLGLKAVTIVINKVEKTFPPTAELCPQCRGYSMSKCGRQSSIDYAMCACPNSARLAVDFFSPVHMRATNAHSFLHVGTMY